ncbi:MAG: anhydro-N-acetylmuramic acid kinase, partial [Bacteroidales bacterium]
MKNYTVIGMMSGTSLDGLDIALCRFSKTSEKWSYRIIHSVTIPYPAVWKERLATADQLTGTDIISLDNEYGKFLGQKVNEFTEDLSQRPDFIASHGHTLYHQPERNITLQIGSGAILAAETGITTI